MRLGAQCQTHEPCWYCTVLGDGRGWGVRRRRRHVWHKMTGRGFIGPRRDNERKGSRDARYINSTQRSASAHNQWNIRNKTKSAVLEKKKKKINKWTRPPALYVLAVITVTHLKKRCIENQLTHHVYSSLTPCRLQLWSTWTDES